MHQPDRQVRPARLERVRHRGGGAEVGALLAGGRDDAVGDALERAAEPVRDRAALAVLRRRGADADRGAEREAVQGFPGDVLHRSPVISLTMFLRRSS